MEALRDDFKKIFDREYEEAFFSPGRVNLIGEHTDYNGGHVFPAAITLGTYGLIAWRQDKQVQCYSNNFQELGVISFSLDGLNYHKEDSWVNYVKGVIKYLEQAGVNIGHGFDLLVYGNIPNGAGLSSSASLEMLVAYALNQAFQGGLTRPDLAQVGMQVENQFIGVNSGIMDQFAVAMGQRDHGIFLDVNTMDYEMVPADFQDYKILIMNTNKRRELADSKYNQRRQECEEALSRLQAELEIASLGELSAETYETHRHLIGDGVLERRAKHAVEENERTIAAKAELTSGDLVAFGQLLNQSHMSLRDDYEVTGVELDTLVETAWQQEGVLGARMTGAGMGGCAIALVHGEAVESVSNAIQSVYEAQVGYPAGFFVAEIGPGVSELDLSQEKGVI